MLVTNNEQLYDSLRYYKNICFPLNGNRNYLHEDIGFNYRMSNVIAAIGLAQVEKADEYRAMRIANNRLYRKLLSEVPGIVFQSEPHGYLNVAWMNNIVIEPEKYGRTRDELLQYLKDNGIETRLLFNGMHRQESLKKYGCDISGHYLVSDRLTANGFYLPSASNLSEEKIQYICEKIQCFR
jgi:perosamine synthetase